MGLYTHVKNGTGAGIRKAHTAVPKEDWTCTCGASCRYYWRNCPSCFKTRKEAT